MRDKVFNNKPISFCYGCQACTQACTQKAITMNPDEEGFVYPQIDTAKCVDCGLCEKVCPTQDKNLINQFHACPEKVYALWNKSLNERLLSTSGGAFMMLAHTVLKEGGVIYGVGYNDDMVACHKRIDNLNDLNELRGSKYMQSDVGMTFKLAKDDLKAGRKVLYSGTPCQIAGLKLFLRKTYDNLVTVDLVCHGTPSPFVFKEYVKHLEKKYDDEMTNFEFRAKNRSGWRSYARYSFKHRNSVRFFWGGDYYCHAFHSGYLNRESCFRCQFSKSERVGDITLTHIAAINLS